MKRLIKLSENRIRSSQPKFKRYLFNEIDWEQNLNLVKGHRGTGKTTLLLQHAKENEDQSIYLSLDDIFFESNRLVELAEELYRIGYRRFYLDEVHRYKNWSKDLKNLFDNYTDVNWVATGSSILEINEGQADLSRRAVVYDLPGLSYREFLELEHQKKILIIPLEEILNRHHEIAADLGDSFDVRKTFQQYLKFGYFPFFKEGKSHYGQKLQRTTNLVIDLDTAPFMELSYSTVRHIKKLLYIIGQSVPFTPNISKLAKRMGIPRNSVLKALDLLDHARIVSLLRKDTRGISYLQKPEKIYLNNPNLAWLLAEDRPDVGNLRETFFFNQASIKHQVLAPKYGDFLIDNSYIIEVGGPNKTTEQIRGIPNVFIAADGIEGGSGRKIPLWLFGLLY